MSAGTYTRRRSALDSFFHISERGSTVWQEIRGGVVTFMTMGYILALNPIILGFVQDGAGKFLGGKDVPDLPAIAAGTALVAGVMTIAMGLFAKYPVCSPSTRSLWPPASASTPSWRSASPPRRPGRTPWVWWSSRG